MIRSWLFEFLHAPGFPDTEDTPEVTAASFEQNLAIWEDCERLGFEGIFFSEHHFIGYSNSPSPNLLIAAASQRTTRLRLGVMGNVLPFYEPWRVLEEIGMLDHLTRGRLEVGFAAGIPQEISSVGLTSAEARERFDEMLEILDKGLLEGSITHHGKHWNFDNFRIYPKPRQQPSPPRWTTIVSEGSARKSARRDTAICTSFQSVESIAAIFDAYREEAARSGNAFGPDRLAIRRNVSIAPTEDAALEMRANARETARSLMAGDTRVRPQESGLLDAPSKNNGFTVHDDEFIAGTPAQVAEQIADQCRRCGAGHFVATLARGAESQRPGAVKLFGEKVVPVLRQATLDA